MSKLCGACGGSGRQTCSACGGIGRRVRVDYGTGGMAGHYIPIDQKDCGICHGVGSWKCPHCGGAGRVKD